MIEIGKDFEHIRHVAKLKLDVGAKAFHDWLEPIVAAMSIDEFAKPIGFRSTVTRTTYRVT